MKVSNKFTKLVTSFLRQCKSMHLKHFKTVVNSVLWQCICINHYMCMYILANVSSSCVSIYNLILKKLWYEQTHLYELVFQVALKPSKNFLFKFSGNYFKWMWNQIRKLNQDFATLPQIIYTRGWYLHFYSFFWF